MRPASAAPLLALIVTTACASTPAVRSLASQNGAYVQSLSNGTDSFIASANELNAQGEARLQRLSGDSATLESEAREQRLAWDDSGDSVRAATFDRVSSLTAGEIIDAMSPSIVSPVSVAPVKGGYAASIKALAEVSTRPETSSEVMELLTFGWSIRSAYGDLQDKAAKADAGAGAAAASQQAKQSGSAVGVLQKVSKP
jgi:hypothetical protein